MTINDIVTTIKNDAGDAPIDIAMVLGSGLGDLKDALKDSVMVPYSKLHGFPQTGVSGHGSGLYIGQMGKYRVAILAGRSHYYEHGKSDAMRLPLETVAKLGATKLILTNAAGSLSTDIPPGSVMQITDHINYSGLNPLIGEDTDLRFVNMVNAYDTTLNAQFQKAAAELNIPLEKGVYAWYSGPSFETPAEIRMLQMLGATAVGMSTVPEVILARFFGLTCAAFSVITNMGAGLSDEKLSHDHTKEMAPIGAAKLKALIEKYMC